MLYYLLMVSLFVATIYNLIKYSEITHKISLTRNSFISILVIFILLIFSAIYIFTLELYSLLLLTMIGIFSITSIIARGFNKRRLYNPGTITNIVRTIPWKEVTSISLEYLVDDYVDVIYSTNKIAFRHRYVESMDEIILKIKRDLKLSWNECFSFIYKEKYET